MPVWWVHWCQVEQLRETPSIWSWSDECWATMGNLPLPAGFRPHTGEDVLANSSDVPVAVVAQQSQVAPWCQRSIGAKVRKNVCRGEAECNLSSWWCFRIWKWHNSLVGYAPKKSNQYRPHLWNDFFHPRAKQENQRNNRNTTKITCTQRHSSIKLLRAKTIDRYPEKIDLMGSVQLLWCQAWNEALAGDVGLRVGRMLFAAVRKEAMRWPSEGKDWPEQGEEVKSDHHHHHHHHHHGHGHGHGSCWSIFHFMFWSQNCQQRFGDVSLPLLRSRLLSLRGKKQKNERCWKRVWVCLLSQSFGLWFGDLFVKGVGNNNLVEACRGDVSNTRETEILCSFPTNFCLELLEIISIVQAVPLHFHTQTTALEGTTLRVLLLGWDNTAPTPTSMILAWRNSDAQMMPKCRMACGMWM